MRFPIIPWARLAAFALLFPLVVSRPEFLSRPVRWASPPRMPRVTHICGVLPTSKDERMFVTPLLVAAVGQRLDLE